MEKFLTIILVVGLLSLINQAIANNSFGEWTRWHGGGAPPTYRFVKAYAKMNDERLQRIDFTYIKESGWFFYITLPLIPVYDPVVITVKVDNKYYSFKGTSTMNKMNWSIDEEFINALSKSSQIITIGQKYTGDGDFSYQSTLDSTGLSNALTWAGKLK